MKKRIELLNTDFLIKCLFRQIYQIYDHGGISMGRGRSSVLLEAAMFMISLPEELDPDIFSFDELLEEAKRRLTKKDRLKDVSFAGQMKHWKDSSVIFLIFVRLLDWIRQLEKKQMEKTKIKEDEEHSIGINEKKLLAAINGLFIKPADLPDAQEEDLIEESNRRIRIKSKRRQKKVLGY